MKLFFAPAGGDFFNEKIKRLNQEPLVFCI